jgi:hypothetical protein
MRTDPRPPAATAEARTHFERRIEVELVVELILADVVVRTRHGPCSEATD